MSVNILLCFQDKGNTISEVRRVVGRYKKTLERKEKINRNLFLILLKTV